MDANTVKSTIKTKLSTVLPGLLTAAGLNDFQDYLDTPPTDGDRRQLGIYVADEEDTIDLLRLAILIQAQLPGEPDGEQKYHSVIMKAIREHVTPELVGFHTRQRIFADCYPLDRTNSTLNFYEIDFQSELDDCDY